jgi:uncharacterized protein (DUF362 family)
MEGVLRAMRDRDAGEMTELAVGERCGITIPTRRAFEGAKYNPMLERVGGVKRYCFEEEPQVEIAYTHPARLRDYVFTPEPVAKADFFVNCPKFKAHPWTTVTFSMKNYIGIQDDRHRLIDHDHRLNEKIADLQYIIQPQLIAIDAITAGEGRMLTPIPFPLHLVMLGDNQVAFDAVCCHIIGVDPLSVDHIRLAHERGFGPVELDEIDVAATSPSTRRSARAKGFKVGLIRVEKYFEGTAITAYAGRPAGEREAPTTAGADAPAPSRRPSRSCASSTPSSTPRCRAPTSSSAPTTAPSTRSPARRWSSSATAPPTNGEVAGKLVQIRSTYKPRDTKDPHTIAHDDIFAKMASVMMKLRAAKGEQVVRFEGCPVSVAEQVLMLVFLSGAKNPFFEPGESLAFNKAYLQWRGTMAMKRLQGIPYQKPGPAPRGEAAPVLDAPADAE